MATIYASPTQLSTTGIAAATWFPISLSGIVPPGTTGVILNASNTSGSFFSARMTGSSDAFLTNCANGASQAQLICGLDSNLSFDFYSSVVTGALKLFLLGYFSDDAVFFGPNATAVSGYITNAWADKDLSAYVPAGALAAICTFGQWVATSGFRVGSTDGGSSDGFTAANSNGSQTVAQFIVGLDSARKAQFIAGANNQLQLKLLGYITKGLVWNTNGINQTPGTAGSFQNLPVTTGATGYIYFLKNITAIANYTLAPNSSASLPYLWPCKYAASQMVCGLPPTGKLANITNQTLFEQGYFTAPPSGAAPPECWAGGGSGIIGPESFIGHG